MDDTTTELSSASGRSTTETYARAVSMKPQTTTRDPDQLRAGLEAWLAGRVPGARVATFDVPPTNGMSSETILFDAQWPGGGERCVLRLPPAADAAPVFPTYDMRKQYKVMALVSDRSGVPVPPLLWLEEDPSHLGSPFFVMGRVEGRVPPDLPPYVFGSWLTEATIEEQRRLQDLSVQVVADLHAIALESSDVHLLASNHPGDTPLQRHVASTRAYLDWVIEDGLSSPLLDRCFEWLGTHLPTDEGPAQLSWGDARIGNILYDGFEPVAVLDWEMADIAPAGVDLGWMVFLHQFFQNIADVFDLSELAEFMRPRDVADEYERLTGTHLTDDELRWYVAYAATRHGVVMFRIARRMAMFDGTPLPDDPDDMINHANVLRDILDGTYWPRLGL